ncbi:MAG: sulfite exporter TauE/SafE family protein [Pirellulaceae bacterium]
MIGLVICAILIGLVLGLLGSGGSILTLPVLVYFLGHTEKVAIAESSAIVGFLALFAAIPAAYAKNIDWRNVVYFGIPGTLGAYFAAWGAKWVSGSVQLLVFSLVLFPAAWVMFRGGAPALPCELDAGEKKNAEAVKHHSAFWIVLEGLFVGGLTGLVGIGGGFLIVPALVILGRLPIRLAVGTSLLVIFFKSMSSFARYQTDLVDRGLSVDWVTIGWFVVFGTVGTVAGQYLACRLNQQVLKRVFAIFLLVMGIFVMGHQILKMTGAAESGAAQGQVEDSSH